MPRSDIPAREGEFLEYTGTLGRKVAVSPDNFGVPAKQSSDYLALWDAFNLAYQKTVDRETRSPASTTAKETARKALLAATRSIIDVMQAWPAMTDNKRSQLGITIRDRTPTPVPPPTEPPVLEVIGVDGHAITVKIKRTGTGRGRPAGAAFATLMSYVGETWSSDERDWHTEGNTTRAVTTLVLPQSVLPGTKVWLSATWSNPRAQTGPAAEPVSTFVQFGGLRKAA